MRMKRIILLGVVMVLCAVVGVYGVVQEAHTPSGWLNGVSAIAFVVPSCALLLSLPNLLFLGLYKKKRTRDLTSALCPAVFNLAGMIAALIHYGFPGSWDVIVVPCFIISALLGAVSLFVGRLFWAMRPRRR